jgi:ubiquinone/menaquinone biosynthesis C-methylase UbiE
MHRMHNQPRAEDGPRTAGNVLHWASEYDIFSSLAGMGVNRRGSRMVIELAGIEPGEAVLDVACGSGSLTLTAESYAGRNGKVYGIDASPEMIRVAKRKASRSGSAVIFQLGLAEKLEFPAAAFDVVISRLAIHHLPEEVKAGAFAEMLRVLKPGGRVLIADFVQPKNHFMSHIASALVGSHMMETSAWSLPPLLKEAGFTEVSSGPTRSSFLAFVSGRKPEG